MANYCYLCASAGLSTYPSRNEPNFDPERQTIACDVGGIPLLWLAMFRTRDWKTTPDPETPAPVVKKSVALDRLASRPVLDHLFSEYGSMDRHAALLREAVADSPGSYVTIEVEEVAALHGDLDVYYSRLRKALTMLSQVAQALERFRPAPLAARSFRTVADFPSRIEALKYLRERTEAGLAEIREVLAANGDDLVATLAVFQSRRNQAERARDRWGDILRELRSHDSRPEEPWELFANLAQIPLGRKFPDPDAMKAGAPDDDFVMLTRLLGAEHFRPVPW